MTVKYAPDELFSITDFTKKIAGVLKGIKEQSIDKIGILKNNKLEAVVISMDEYERLKSLEALFETIEHKEIYDVIQLRKTTPLSSYLSIEDMASQFNIDMKQLQPMYAIKNHPLVKEDLKALDHSLVLLVFKKLKQLQIAPHLGQSLGNKYNMDLSGYKKVYLAKKKVRIVYKIIDDELVIYVISIGKREDMEVYQEAIKRV